MVEADGFPAGTARAAVAESLAMPITGGAVDDDCWRGRRIARAVSVPGDRDAEAGYGLTASELATGFWRRRGRVHWRTVITLPAPAVEVRGRAE